MTLKPQQQKAFLKGSTLKYERELKEFNRLVNTREMIKQLLLILGDITGKLTNLVIATDDVIQKQLKSDLWLMVFKPSTVDLENDALNFDKQYIKCNLQKVPFNNNIENMFETKMENSIFNQTPIEIANSMGEKFFSEYVNFHGYELIKDKIEIPIVAQKEIYIMPELDFDANDEL